ncbi:YbaB/EbfC family DNA-binding protein [Nonomuraea longicatena]|uniref:YbaB/EbfC DNA-binding family protein n=1 Tax=Nonomuraea longicatena TaxID=83682 RepID=A0ABN1P5V3_9ACTN
MDGFGDFGKIDVDKLMETATAQFARAEQTQAVLASVVGRAGDEDGLVSVEYGVAGLRELELHPKAMRLSSGELAERIKQALADAAADLNEQVNAAMVEAFGEEGNPLKFLNDPDAALQDLKSAESAYHRTYDDVMGELDQIRRRLNL